MIIDQEEFCGEVERLHAHHHMTMFEAIFLTCDKNNIDCEYVGPLINRSIREKLNFEAVERNLMTERTHSLYDLLNTDTLSHIKVGDKVVIWNKVRPLIKLEVVAIDEKYIHVDTGDKYLIKNGKASNGSIGHKARVI